MMRVHQPLDARNVRSQIAAALFLLVPLALTAACGGGPVSPSSTGVPSAASSARASAAADGTRSSLKAFVQTDQADYAPGSVVTISGDNSNGIGYAEGHTVDVAVTGPNGWTSSCSATVAADGTWSCQITLNSDPAIAVGDYSYTATSTDADGNSISETGTFTDGPSFNVAIDNIGTAFLGVPTTFTANLTGGCVSGATFSYLWETTAGTATFSSTSAASPSVTFTSLGTVTLKVTVTKQTGTCDDTVKNDTQDVTVTSTTTTQTLTPGTITYGQSSAIVGTLIENPSGDGIPGRTIVVTSNSTAACGGTATNIGSDDTEGGGTTPPRGNWSLASPYRPDGAGTEYIKADYDGTGNNAPSSDCDTLTIDKAPTATSITNTPPLQIGVGVPFDVAYRVKSGYGILGNSTAGAVTVAKQSGPGTLCTDSDTLNQAQGNADGTGADNAGFEANGTLTCSADAVGFYTYRVNYAGDDNYLGSYSSPDSSIDIISVQACPAAPAIASAYLRANNIKINIKNQENIVQLIADEMAKSREARFPTYTSATLAGGSLLRPCDVGYQSSVENKTAYWVTTKRP